MGRFEKGHTAWNKGLKGVMEPHSGCFKDGNIPWNKGKRGFKLPPLSEEAKIKISKVQTGATNSHWKGGRFKSPKGYISVIQKGHPGATNQGYIFEHRLVMEKHIGRYLEPKEVVHHKNEIRDDNRLENLQLFTNHVEHDRHHAFLRKQKNEVRKNDTNSTI